MRGRLGWTQKDLAAAAGVTQTAISQLEMGKQRSKAVLEAVRRAFEEARIPSGSDDRQAGEVSPCPLLLEARWSLQRNIAREP